MKPAAHPPRLRRLLWLPALALVAACDPVWDISGKVVHCGDATALEGVSVSLVVRWAPDTVRRVDGVTDSRGAFWVQLIAGLDSPATLTFSKPGYVEVTREYSRAPSRGAPVELCLKPVEAPRPKE